MRLKKQEKFRGYKANRRTSEAPVLVIFECPGCGFRTQGAKPEEAEIEYVLHLNNVHHGPLECAFCDRRAGNGVRWLPCFATLARHTQFFHREVAPADPEAIPPRAFR